MGLYGHFSSMVFFAGHLSGLIADIYLLIDVLVDI